MAKPSIGVQSLVLTELRRRYDKISHDYDNTRIKVLTMLGGGLVYLSYLYAPRGGDPHADLFFPHNLAGQIFYIIGLFLSLGALGVFFWAVRPADWALPMTVKEIDEKMKFYSTEPLFLDYLKREYVEATNFCMKQMDKKVKLLNVGINMLFVGAIILMVLRYFGG